MGIRVSLIAPVNISVYRLDIQSTWARNPPGPAAEGYNYLLREPVVSRAAGVRTVARAEMAPVLIPAQVEVQTFQQLAATFGGDSAATEMAFVCHRKDLGSLGLLDANLHCLLKPGDRVDHIEKNGRTVQTFIKQLYVLEVRPKSWGFGPDGYDLEIIYTTYRSADPRRTS